MQPTLFRSPFATQSTRIAQPAAMTGAPPGPSHGVCLVAATGRAAPSDAALTAAREHAHASGASIILLHVLAERVSPLYGAVSPAEARVRAHLDAVASGLRADGLDARPLLRAASRGSSAVIQVAQQIGATLIVLTDRPRPRFVRFLRDRTGAALTRAAPCPVVVIRSSSERSTRSAPLRFEVQAAAAGPLEPRAAAYRTVDVNRIVGVADSAGETAAFGPDLRPLRRTPEEETHFRQTVRALERDAYQPPAQLRKLGYGYYVERGHTQVAAAKHLGQLWLDALVTEHVPTADPLIRRALDNRLQFERATGLTRIGATSAETYGEIERLIHDFGARERIADLREASARWYAAVFRPLQLRVREARLHQLFAGERSADVVLRVARFDTATGLHAATWDELVSSFTALLRSTAGPDALAA